ncbi:MAG: hypothetical protein U0793_03930 [Gemmataceae bacterium]
MRRALIQIGLALTAVAGLVALLFWLHPALLERLRGQDRFRLPLRDVQCPTPPGLTRGEFLDQTQYYASLPESLELLEDGLEEKLKEAFAKHPWVERVDAVRVLPRTVEVGLTFRRPVLAVKSPAGIRAVDPAGVLLPRNAVTEGLPLIDGEAPRGPEGAPWGDPRVEKAARLAEKK